MNKPEKETLTVEFKSDKKCLSMDVLYKELVAMANTDGGVLCLGVEDNGVVTGVHAQHKNTIQILGDIQTHIILKSEKAGDSVLNLVLDSALVCVNRI